MCLLRILPMVEVLIYNESTELWEKNTLTDGTGISITEGAGSITIANSGVTSAVAGTGISVSGSTGAVTITNSAPDQTVALTGAGTTSITGTYPNFTITSNDAYTGTVTSVGGTGTVNGISLSGTVTSSGNLTLGGTLSSVSLTTQVSGTLPIANGGTGQTTANAALNALLPSQTSNSGKFLTTNGTDTSWGTAVTITFPFYKSSGSLDTIALVSNSYLPFYNYASTAKNIALTT